FFERRFYLQIGLQEIRGGHAITQMATERFLIVVYPVQHFKRGIVLTVMFQENGTVPPVLFILIPQTGNTLIGFPRLPGVLVFGDEDILSLPVKSAVYIVQYEC